MQEFSRKFDYNRAWGIFMEFTIHLQILGIVFFTGIIMGAFLGFVLLMWVIG